jgi:hypothetical protein
VHNGMTGFATIVCFSDVKAQVKKTDIRLYFQHDNSGQWVLLAR